MEQQTADRLVYLHESMHLQLKMQDAGWEADVERWETDEESNASDDEEDHADSDRLEWAHLCV